MNNAYDKIESLAEIEWIQHRAETFVGTTSEPTHLFEEVFDNALDEVLSGGATTVHIEIKNGYCKIKDDGRGFPVTNDETGVPYPVKACTKLYTSGKFKKSMNAYEVSAGLNGIGLVAVAALSDSMTIISHRDGHAHEYNFKTSFTEHKIDHEVKDKVKSPEKGTIIYFKPSKKIFRSVEFDVAYIKERIQLVKMLTDANVFLKIDDKDIDIEADKSKILESFFEDASGNDTHCVKVKNDKESVYVYFYFDMVKNEPRFKGSVNLLPVHRGTHIKYIRNVVPNILMSNMPKNNILTKNDYLIGIRCFVSAHIKDPRFTGQTKDELDIDVKRFDPFEKSFVESFEKVLKEDINIKELYQRFLDYKQSLETKQAAKKLKKRKFTANLLDSVKYGKGTFLFMVEGDSAAGSLVKCRDRNKHAVYTLTGKSMPNVEANKSSKILGNATVTDLFNVLGKDNDMSAIDDPEKVRYEYIAVTTDPDIDGYHITVMVLKFFNKFFPQLIETGRVVLPQIPLYGYYNGKVFTPVYDNDDAKKLMDSGKTLMRHKGLGEFDPDELEVVLFKHSRFIVPTKASIKKMEDELKLGSTEEEVVTKMMETKIVEEEKPIAKVVETPVTKPDKITNEDVPTFEDFIF